MNRPIVLVMLAAACASAAAPVRSAMVGSPQVAAVAAVAAVAPADTLTSVYDVAGLRVIHRRSNLSTVVMNLDRKSVV